MKYLNLGCGNKFHPNWINVDMYPADPSVLACNFSSCVPFESNYFDVVYHSHVIEHFSQSKGRDFIKECFRILKPGGIIRIAFPDLEKIVLEYIKNLNRIDLDDQGAKWDYDWIMLELYDQTVRNENGGKMLKYLENSSIQNKEYVFYRIGDHKMSRNSITQVNPVIKEEIYKLKKIIGIKENIGTAQKIRSKVSNAIDKICFAFLSQREKENIKIGRFRNNGEIHQWMYDRVSMKRLLEDSGFIRFEIRSAMESYIDNWATFNLDNPNEHSSLFVEAIKPAINK